LAEVEFNEESIEDSSEEEPEIFKCERCRKTFKSDKQLENHENSKKHKEAYKKWIEK
jgi:DnaJ family protein A protein 5